VFFDLQTVTLQTLLFIFAQPSVINNDEKVNSVVNSFRAENDVIL